MRFLSCQDAVEFGMSALLPIADTQTEGWCVRFEPEADVTPVVNWIGRQCLIFA